MAGLSDYFVPGDPNADAMTHWAPEPNPAEPYTRKAIDFFNGGLKGAGVDVMPGWVDRIGALFQNPDNLAAIGMATGKWWSPAELTKLRTIAQAGGLKATGAAEVEGLPGRIHSAAYTKANKLGMVGGEGQAPYRGVYQGLWADSAKIDQLLALKKQGISHAEIARRIGSTPGAVSAKLYQLGIGADAVEAAPRVTPSLPQIKSMGSADNIDPAELNEYMKIFGGR